MHLVRLGLGLRGEGRVMARMRKKARDKGYG